MFYRRKKKGFFYYLKRLICLFIAVYGIYFLYQQHSTFNAEKILAQSALKNKTFSAVVKEIDVGSLKAYLLEEHSNPIVSMNFEFENAGYAHDEEGKYGLANLAIGLITEGAGEYDDKQLHDLLEENGIRIKFSVLRDGVSGYMITPKDNLKTAQHLLKQIIYSPRLPEEILEIKKTQMLKALEQQKENPGSELSLAFLEHTFANHPYARNPIGNAEDIESIKTDDIREYLLKSLAKQTLTIGIAGDITQEESIALMRDVFDSLPEESAQIPLEKLDYTSNGEEFKLNREIPQVIAAFSSKGVFRSDKDFYALYIANYILGGSGLTSRLNKVLREDNGLTYGISTTFSDNQACALIRGGFSVSAENYEKAKKLLLAEWQNMAQKGISEDELNKTKKSLIDSYNLRFADIDNMSAMLVAMQRHNLGIDFLQKRNDYIKNVSLDEVNKAAALYLSALPNFVTIGPERKEN